jgi:thiol-disulfide isomerase/thioredoxin
VSRRAVARNVGLAAALVALPAVRDVSLTLEGWLALGVGVLFVSVAALGVAVVALAREVGLLRLRLPPAGALELAHEGPPVGARTALAERFPFDSRTRFALAVFESPGCPLCRRLAPAVAAFAREPELSVRVFDEEADADAWHEVGVPGSPFAIALDREGVVRAKGTFNSYGQLESVLAAAEGRVLAAARA